MFEESLLCFLLPTLKATAGVMQGQGTAGEKEGGGVPSGDTADEESPEGGAGRAAAIAPGPTPNAFLCPAVCTRF